jgi:hypothetical protein
MVDRHVTYQQVINYQILKEDPLLCSEGRSITGRVGEDNFNNADPFVA